MSADASVEAAIAPPNLNLSPEEKRVYMQLFRLADAENVGVVTGEIAVKFFEKTRLDQRVLGEIWQIADKENLGFLLPAGFSLVLRLIGHAQAGREPTLEVASQQGPLPVFDGIKIANPPPPPAPAPTPAPAAAPIQAQGTGSGPIRIPPLTPEKVSQYASLFERQNLQNGSLLPGDQAKNIFEKSGLPNEVLGRIWQLADTEQRGALVLTEFVIAMHLLTSMKSRALTALPNILPAALYEAATRRGSAPRQSPTATGNVMSAIPRQMSGQAQVRTSNPLGRPPMGPQATTLAPQTTGNDWLIAPIDKAKFDQIFDGLDKSKNGYITGEEAVPFLSQSNLGEDALAQIWDLCDMNSEGRLNKDTFAVVMYFIRLQRSRKDVPLPTTLPPNLIPPSMRNQPQRNIQPSPFDAPAPAPAPPQLPQPPKSALEDLFGLDTSPAPASAQVASPTGGSVAKVPFAGGAAGSPAHVSPTASTFKPFVPSSSFGRTLTTHDTGGSSSSAQAHRAPPQPTVMEDLLGESDPEVNKRLTNESMELANLANQVGSLSKEMQQVQGQRSQAQTNINQASEQKKNFEQRLSQLRTLYEKEAQDVRTLDAQLRTIREETRKLTNELVTIDGTYQDLQSQHRQIHEALQTDQQENASLKQRISTANSEIAQLKPQIEKLKSEARQQKGLVAINKKQLSTTEGDRDKLKTEVEDLTKSNEELARQIDSSPPVTAPAQVASPAPSTASANNPFFKRTQSSDIMGAFASPPLKPYGEKSFDDIFGVVGPSSSSSTPAPPVSFKQQHTGTSTASAGSFATPAGSTPTVSRQPTLTVDPPAPPESRQMSSSFLPFGAPSDSLTSSRQVSPPLSRASDSTPAASSTPAPLEPSFTGQSATSASEFNKASAASSQQKPSSSVNGSIPGAFPDETPGVTAPSTSFSPTNESDPFAGMKDTSNTKVDFDSAFASFASSSSKPQDTSTKDNSNAFSNFHSEFPPISELERDDDSDSGSEDNRFDDDFSPSSPPNRKAEAIGSPQLPSSPTTTKSPINGPEESAAVKSHTSQPSNDLSAFSNPSQASPTFPPTSTSENPFPASPTTVTNTAPVASKGAPNDSDDDFEGLEDAKEGSADDEFANISRSNLDDFNPVFDSPPPSQPKSESTNVSNAFGIDSSYDFGTVSSTSATTANAAPANNTMESGKASTATDNHDWDAIFADLDPPANATNVGKSGEATSPAQSPTGGPARPGNFGRALTEEGKHDDPLVKHLTELGYSRVDAVNALEKYDYNLERAANFLASQS